LSKKIWEKIKGRIGKTVVKTLIFNMAITLFIFYLVLHKNDIGDLLDVFIISLLVFLCAYTFAKITVNFINEKSIRQSIISITLWILAGALTGSILGCLFFHVSGGQNEERVLKDIFSYSFVFGIISGLGFFYYFYAGKKLEYSEKRIQEEKIKRLTLEKETALTTMRLMQAQIEPHFLFNTLSNIVSLFDIEVETAKKMLIDLNEYLRISLQRTRQEMITLEQELEIIRRYLDIFQVRMGKRLSYKIEKRGDCSQIPFPPMIIQPLVENAIKHGLEPKKEGGCIKIECSLEKDYLKVAVSDTGLGMDSDNDITGIGLSNVSSRLHNIYGDRARLIVEANKPSGVKVTVEVPL
jgi:sensor histidine kinase YesM